MISLDVCLRDLATVRKILAGHLREYDVYAFGSRITGKARKASDLDLVVMTGEPLDTLRMADLREAFSESDLPFKVDIADWASIKENFRKIIQKDRFKMQTANHLNKMRKKRSH